MNKRWTIGGTIAIALLVIAAWAFGWLERKDPALAELEKLRDEGLSRQGQMTEEEQRASREKFGEQMRDVPEETRRKFFESSMPVFMRMFEAQTDRFLAMSPEEQRKEMDKRIDDMKARMNAPGQGGPPPGGGAGGPGGNGPRPSAQQMDEMRKKMLDWTTPEQRAKFEKVMQKYSERLKQRGMDPMPGGGFF